MVTARRHLWGVDGGVALSSHSMRWHIYPPTSWGRASTVGYCLLYTQSFCLEGGEIAGEGGVRGKEGRGADLAPGPGALVKYIYIHPHSPAIPNPFLFKASSKSFILPSKLEISYYLCMLFDTSRNSFHYPLNTHVIPQSLQFNLVLTPFLFLTPYFHFLLSYGLIGTNFSPYPEVCSCVLWRPSTENMCIKIIIVCSICSLPTTTYYTSCGDEQCKTIVTNTTREPCVACIRAGTGSAS